ncbi:MAG: DUF2497 domain-containing protein [Alphaproteobacteria bacterium]|nr:DUF2497 domain-containing protein [Alphaproteobacteria bacterium]NCQ87953.1 DUF2497 domain-containing protein [Alphaproteobacteria bacterium]NCT05540.1 DUF2497 domain-containing protein [Alphaproteobacteria bacterium]
MSEKPTDQEPSIEEILASIRQIISDDDEEETGDEDNVVAQDDDMPSFGRKDEDDDVLELTEDMQDIHSFDANDSLDFVDADDEEDFIDEPIEAPQIFSKEPPRKRESVPSSILSESTQQATMSSLSKLVGSVPLSRGGYDGITLEDIVRELLNPMLRDWMDDNLPPMVERLVEKEIKKLSRRALDD